MSDLISRQAALDAMETWDKFGCDPDGKLVRYDDDKHYIPYVHYEDMVHAIKHLPSAQPEQRWIPCSERLPEKNCRCLTTNEAWGSFEVDWNAWIDGQWLYPNEKPIAWMPLPEPYRGGDSE